LTGITSEIYFSKVELVKNLKVLLLVYFGIMLVVYSLGFWFLPVNPYQPVNYPEKIFFRVFNKRKHPAKAGCF
jgi:hypothetical protein